MNITYKNPGYTHSLDSISLFLTGEETSFWSAPIFHFYPQLDKQTLMSLNGSDKQKYLNDVFGDIYENLREEINRKVICYNVHFQNHKRQIEEALSEAFDLDASSIFNDLTSNVTLNPICPRFLKECYFDVFYMNSEKGALGLSLHEVIHYFWFYVWNSHFGDSQKTFFNDINTFFYIVIVYRLYHTSISFFASFAFVLQRLRAKPIPLFII